MHEYIHPRLRPRQLDIYVVRRAILRTLLVERRRFHGLVLDVGCGYKPYRRLATSPPSRATGYVGVDLPGTVYGTPDVAWDGRLLPVADDSAGTVLLTEVLEHTPVPDRVLAEAARVLQPGGVVLVTVPFLWPLHEVPRDEARLTPFALRRLLESSGFELVNVTALGGWDAALAQLLGLWVRRRLIGSARNRFLRGLASLPVLAVMWLLTRIDTAPTTFGEGTMITGLAATAVKLPGGGTS